MTRSHVLRSFKQAGFSLRDEGFRHEYHSSIIRIIVDSSFHLNLPIRIYYRHHLSEFESPEKAIAFIRARLSMQVVGGTDYALRTDRRGSLELIMGGAA